jgi:hypothetical protein
MGETSAPSRRTMATGRDALEASPTSRSDPQTEMPTAEVEDQPAACGRRGGGAPCKRQGSLHRPIAYHLPPPVELGLRLLRARMGSHRPAAGLEGARDPGSGPRCPGDDPPRRVHPAALQPAGRSRRLGSRAHPRAVSRYMPGPRRWGRRHGRDGRRISAITEPPLAATCLWLLYEEHPDEAPVRSCGRFTAGTASCSLHGTLTASASRSSSTHGSRDATMRGSGISRSLR